MKRARIIFSRNLEEETKYYRVYRSNKKGVTRKEKLIMKVMQPVNNKLKIENDKLIRINPLQYRTKYKRVIADVNPEISIKLNGENIEELGISYSVEYDDGIITFSSVLQEADILMANYHIDAIKIWDTDEVYQELVEYYGPTAKDTSVPSKPENISIIANETFGYIRVDWNHSTTNGEKFYYCIEAVDEYENFSNFYEEVEIELNEGNSLITYLVQKRKTFDEDWKTISRQKNNYFIEHELDKQMPGAPKNLTCSETINRFTGEIYTSLNWDGTLDVNKVKSPMYRVIAVSKNGIFSDASSATAQIYFDSVIKKYVIRRKEYDGSFPSYHDTESITVGFVNGNINTFKDDTVDDEINYGYSVFAVDMNNNHSLAATIEFTTGDATAPEKVIDITSYVYSYLL